MLAAHKTRERKMRENLEATLSYAVEARGNKIKKIIKLIAGDNIPIKLSSCMHAEKTTICKI